MLDDVGFSAPSAFGGACNTPVAERLASEGLKYTRFHTTGLCSPTRMALLSGRNHHSVGMGSVADMATSAPGYNSVRPKDKATIAEILKLNGYATSQFGKCHEVPTWESNPFGPFDQWPVGNGFEYFYGFVGGETNQWYPAIYEGTSPVQPDRLPEEGYHFMEDMTDKSIAWVRQHTALLPDQPFFLYFAPGATHAPHHVPLEWANNYRGQFDDGWDALRERVFARQKQIGVIPRDAVLTKRNEGIPRGTTCPTTSSRCSRDRWRCSRASSSTPTTTSAVSSTRSKRLACSTTRSCCTCWVTTARRRRARCRAASTNCLCS
jgi:arylsulfatase